MQKSKKYTSAFILLSSLFFMWGLITVLVDSLIPRLREIFELSYFQAGLVQFAFFIAYALVSIPAGLLLHKTGYKKGIILGLLVMGVGCLLFYPAASVRSFPFFMLAYFILATGITMLQVAANPYVTVLGDEKKASSKLNLAQALNSLGTSIAPAIGAIFILSDQIKSKIEINTLSYDEKLFYLINEAKSVQTPFIILALSLFFLALIILFSKLPPILSSKYIGSYSNVFQHKKLYLGAIAIFLYVGAEVTIGSYLINYFLDLNLADIIRENTVLSSFSTSILKTDLLSTDNKGVVATFVVLYWSGAMFGRFIGAYLTKIFVPQQVLKVFVFGAIIMILISISSNGILAMFSILAVGVFNSIMFPTIFSIALEGLGLLKPQGSGILCTAIAGGAFIPPLFGFTTDLLGFKLAFFIVIFCYGYIYFYAKKSLVLS